MELHNCSHGTPLASLDEIKASSCRDSLTYNWYAELSHRPRILIVESSIPAAAAVVAAPIRNFLINPCHTERLPNLSHENLSCEECSICHIEKRPWDSPTNGHIC